MDPKSESPKIVVTHLQRPAFGIGTSWWQEHFNWVKSKSDDPDTLIIGDFNATLANMGSNQIGQTREMASLLENKPAATWPSVLPAGFGAVIDHIFIGKGYAPIWFGVLKESYGSGHRPIFAIVEKIQ